MADSPVRIAVARGPITTDTSRASITQIRPDGNRLQTVAQAGRPVDLLELPDGSLLLSDDRGDAIYRISYSGN